MKSAKAEDVSICAYEGDEIKNEIFGANVPGPFQRPPLCVIPTSPKSPGFAGLSGLWWSARLTGLGLSVLPLPLRFSGVVSGSRIVAYQR